MIKLITMKNFFLVLYTIFKVLICLLITVFLVYGFMNVSIRPILGNDNWDFQIVFYLLFTLFTLIALWIIPFIKTSIIIKLIPIVLLIVQFKLPHLMPSVIHQFKQIYCIEDGICHEGAEVYRKGQKIIINKENCLKYGWKWNEEGKFCNLNDWARE